MNSILPGSSRVSQQTALKLFLNKPWPRRDILGLGLASMRTTPSTSRMERLSMCKMTTKERSPQTEAKKESIDEPLQSKLASELMKMDESLRKVSEKKARKKVERYAYWFAAIASSVGINSMAAGAVYYRLFGKFKVE